MSTSIQRVQYLQNNYSEPFELQQDLSEFLDAAHEQQAPILVAMVTKILDLATKLEPKSPAWRLKLRRRIESVSLI